MVLRQLVIQVQVRHSVVQVGSDRKSTWEIFLILSLAVVWVVAWEVVPVPERSVVQWLGTTFVLTWKLISKLVSLEAKRKYEFVTWRLVTLAMETVSSQAARSALVPPVTEAVLLSR